MKTCNVFKSVLKTYHIFLRNEFWLHRDPIFFSTNYCWYFIRYLKHERQSCIVSVCLDVHPHESCLPRRMKYSLHFLWTTVIVNCMIHSMSSVKSRFHKKCQSYSKWPCTLSSQTASALFLSKSFTSLASVLPALSVTVSRNVSDTLVGDLWTLRRFWTGTEANISSSLAFCPWSSTVCDRSVDVHDISSST